jgi:hypothetical protein
MRIDKFMPTNPDPDLMRIFDFTAADLEANRAGKMSERQTKYLKQESDANGFIVGCAIWIGLIIVGIVIFASIVFPQGLTGGKSDILGTVSWIPLVLILAFVFMRYRSNQRAHTTAIDSQRAGYVEDNITFYVRDWPERRYPIYHISLDGKRFQIERDCYEAFAKFVNLRGKYLMFRLYFAPENNRILSMEIIPQ